jgi:hypothetical protein
MSANGPPTLSYASRQGIRAKPTHHSALAGCAWLALILAVGYRGSVVAYAYHRSYTYPWARFARNVGNLETFIEIERSIYAIGALMAILALIPSNRKRWAAWLALATHSYCLLAAFDFLTIYRA